MTEPPPRRTGTGGRSAHLRRYGPWSKTMAPRKGGRPEIVVLSNQAKPYHSMNLLAYIDHFYIRLFDAIFDRWPQPVPPLDVLKNGKIISHRGEHDNRLILENTLSAFEQARAGGVWGIELDVRWTRDLVPVVAHDPDLKRVHGIDAVIAEHSWDQLHQKAEAVPTLSDVVARFGGQVHLMIEIKQQGWPDPAKQSRSLQEALSPLTPESDFHFMALQPAVLTHIRGFPSACMLAIANYRPAKYSRWVREHHWGGLCTHYGLLRKHRIRIHHARRQKIGTAYPASRNCLFKELNRGVDWIFSNNACDLAAILAEAIRDAGRQ